MRVRKSGFLPRQGVADVSNESNLESYSVTAEDLEQPGTKKSEMLCCPFGFRVPRNINICTIEIEIW